MPSALVATDPRNPPPSSAATRAVMRANRGTGTGPELLLRRALRSKGLVGYRVNRRIGRVRPDIVFGPGRVAVFVHGCYWHRCPECAFRLPKSNTAFWRAKFAANRARDSRTRRELESVGWKVIVAWAHEIADSPDTIAARVGTAMQRRDRA